MIPWRIAVTGLSGFVGSHFARAVADLDPTIEVISLLQRGASEGDLRSAAGVDRAVATLIPDVILHLAAVALPASARSNPTLAWEVNVMGTLHILEAIRRHSPHCRLVFVGSSEVYGNSFLAFDEPIKETASLLPRTVYGATKAAADVMVAQRALDGLEVIRFRPFNHTGPGQAGSYVISSFARQIARIECGLQRPVIEVGNLEAKRDFLDVRDVVAAYAKASLPDCRVSSGTVFNLATGQPKRIAELLHELIVEANIPVEIRVEPSRVRMDDIPCASGSPELAHEILGWHPMISFEQTLRDVLTHWRACPNADDRTQT